MNRARYRVVIVGGGVIGLFTAWHLANAGVTDVLVLEKGYLSSGASGRNGGGVRQQWDTRATIRLARESVAAFRRFGKEFGYNIWFRQGGYLFLAGTDEELERLRAVQKVVSAEGLPARVLTPSQIGRIAPSLALDGIVGGTFLGSDGTVYPFPLVWGLYEAVRRRGVEVALGVEVLRIRTENGRVVGVETSGGTVGADTVVNAAGGWSSDVSSRAGLAVPNVATRHEILATEPLKPFLDPMVVRPSDGLYFSQTMRGEIVGGVTVRHPTGTAAGVPSSTEFLRSMSRALIGLVPRLRPLGVLRAWSGFYDDTPDGLPILGEDPRLAGFVHANGFGGHGVMVAPAATRRVADAVLGTKSDLDPALFGPGRFLDANRAREAERLQLG
ncbi:MAG: FAD-binding oxidoreductase [Thermoplasmata archaeon]|nr:FAD-binding oxidoreductase [Thermoplasmata archaeon]MCI4353742.1 FAD-binding oxidoreductase [Thermoplasmata archaeon]